ncbi:MAG: twin-arginine translocase subunit TatB [Alphaproteobacteria bacterium]|nr:twin-arginine translocase subunit TatB [Alphaproteobacteria bacterium]
MFDLEWSKVLVIGVIALMVIKPKDLPRVLRTVGYWVRQARQVASEFQSSIEQMAREAELSDVKKEIEDATRKVTSDIEKSIDPVEVEKLFNEPSPPPVTPTDPTIADSTGVAGPTPPLELPPPDEPPLPFPEMTSPKPVEQPSVPKPVEPAHTAADHPAPSGAEPRRDHG